VSAATLTEARESPGGAEVVDGADTVTHDGVPLPARGRIPAEVAG
jgi:hypothetical protein